MSVPPEIIQYLQQLKATPAITPTIEDLLRKSVHGGVEAEPAIPSPSEGFAGAKGTEKFAAILALIGDTLGQVGAMKDRTHPPRPVAPDLIQALRGREMSKRLSDYRTKKADADAAADEAKTRLSIELESQRNIREAEQRAAEGASGRAEEHEYRLSEQEGSENRAAARADASNDAIAGRQSEDDRRQEEREMRRMRETHRMSRLAELHDLGGRLPSDAKLDDINAAIAEKAPKVKEAKTETEGRKVYQEAVMELPALASKLRAGERTREEIIDAITAQLSIMPPEHRANYALAAQRLFGDSLEPPTGPMSTAPAP